MSNLGKHWIIKDISKMYHQGMLGKHHSEESKRKMSLAHKGTKKPWVKGAKNGHKHSEETKKKIVETRIKNNSYKHSEKTKKKLSLIGLQNNHKHKYWLGKKRPLLMTKELRKKMSEAHKGEKSGNWKGGISSINLIIRSGLEYKLWHEAVFARDSWTCQQCGIKNYKGLGKSVKLEAHHIKEFCNYIELRFDINNGITLCVECHNKTKKGRNPAQEI